MVIAGVPGSNAGKIFDIFHAPMMTALLEYLYPTICNYLVFAL